MKLTLWKHVVLGGLFALSVAGAALVAAPARNASAEKYDLVRGKGGIPILTPKQLNGPPVQVEGGLSGGVVGSVLGVPGFGTEAVGASRGGDFDIEGRKPGIGMGDSGT